ncbi:MAG: outer membrane beta-barrel protein [Chloroflexia bacterium]|nr:outer membrane beta-barrel protein [Chloroflexia bacterium]
MRYYNGNETDNYFRQDIINNHRTSTNLQIDYTQSFEKATLELGSKSYYQQYDNNLKGALDAVESTFVYDEIRQALYANYTHKFDKLVLQAGLRTEYAKTNIDEKAENEYIAWLPMLSLKRQLNKSQSIKMNLRRRIYRPGIDDLNPFEVWYDAAHVSKGNSNLTPAYSNDLELVYSKNFNSNMVSPKLFVKYLTDDFHHVSFVNSNNVTETVVDNIGKSWEYGFSMDYSLKLTNWWMLNGFASVSNTIIYSDDSFSEMADNTQEKISFQTNANSVMTFFKSWNFYDDGGLSHTLYLLPKNHFKGFTMDNWVGKEYF